MPQRSKVLELPEKIRTELDRRLVASGFSGYEGLSEWLGEQGLAISKSSLHRYGSAFEERIAALKIATQQAQAIGDAVGDDENALGDALVRLCQQKAFDVLMQFELADPENLDLAKMARAVADLNRSAVQQKKWMADVRAKLERVADELSGEAKSSGISDDFAAQIRAKVLGVVS